LWQLREKTPFFILSGALVIITLYTPNNSSSKLFPLGSRIANASVSFVTYLEKTFWPHDLAIFYPFPVQIPIWRVLFASLFILVISIAVIAMMKRRPYLFVGWFWYAITIAPVIGIVQIAEYAMADHYHYLPSIGIAVMLAWGVPLLFTDKDTRKKILFPAGVASLAILAVLTWQQCSYWKNTISLFERTLNITNRNFIAHMALAGELLDENKINEAITHYNAMLMLNPKSDIALVGLGRAFSIKGENDAAIAAFRQALKLNPESIKAHHNLGFVLFQTGHIDEAIIEYQKAIALNNDDPSLHNNLGNALVKQGKVKEAVREYNEALHINPRHAGNHNNLAMILMQQRRFDEAVKHFREAIRLQPEYANAHFNLARILEKKGDIKEAEYHYREAIRINPEYKDYKEGR
jgi:tetratricopeptide (TPR) repeat protein